MRKAFFFLAIFIVFCLFLPICVYAEFKWNWNDKQDADIGLAFQMGRAFEFRGYCAAVNKYLFKAEREKYSVWQETPSKYWPQLHQSYEKGYQNAKAEMEKK